MMQQGIQSTFPNDELKAAGCHFFVLMKWLEVVEHEEFDNGRLIDLYDTSIDLNLMDHACNVLDAVKVVNIAMGCIGYKRYCKDMKEIPPVDPYIIRLVKPNYTHFLLYHQGKTWDPLVPDRPAASTYSIDSYRVLL